MTLLLLDPSNETAPPLGQPAPRLLDLTGKRIGIISNGKEGTKGYFAHLGRLLVEECGAGEIIHRVKSNYSAPADPHIAAEISGWDAVITGIGD